MELTQQQIQELYKFTEKKYVHWYDLQVELVDHLASKIEEEMSANASLTFEAALEKVYKSFGMFGFAKVVQEKQTQVQNAARNMWWSEMKLFFKLPKIIFLVFLITVLWQLALYIDVAYLTIAYVIAYMIFNMVIGIRFSRVNKKTKPLLLLQTNPWHSSLFVFVYQYFIIFGDLYKTPPFVFSIAAATGIIILLASNKVYFNIRNRAENLYPEAFLMKAKVA